MKVPSFEEAMQSKDIFDYEVHRNVLGWQLSYAGGDLSVCITKEQAEQIIAKMEFQNLLDIAV